MEENKSLNPVLAALDKADAFLDKIITEDTVVADFLARPDFQTVIGLLKLKFPAIQGFDTEAVKYVGYVKNIAKNAKAIIADVRDIVKLASNPLA
jgi:hypothetical protein